MNLSVVYYHLIIFYGTEKENVMKEKWRILSIEIFHNLVFRITILNVKRLFSSNRMLIRAM